MSAQGTIDSFEALYADLVELLSDLLVVPIEEIEAHSLLVDDLDADSVSFLELSYLLQERFGIQMAEVKVDEETLNMNLVDGLERLNQQEGDTTFFEHVKAETIVRLLTVHGSAGEIANLLGVSVPPGMTDMTPVSEITLGDLVSFELDVNTDSVEPAMLEMPLVEALPLVDLDRFFPHATRERLFRSQRVEDLVRGIEGRVPPDINPQTPLNELLLRDLFRFLTVGAMARYLWDLYLKANGDDAKA